MTEGHDRWAKADPPTTPSSCYILEVPGMDGSTNGLFRNGEPNDLATCLALVHLTGNLILSIQGRNREKSRKQGGRAGPWAGSRRGSAKGASWVVCSSHLTAAWFLKYGRWALPHCLTALPGA